jgi:4a-hydroxytetrahydrobiopterin dehydratase
MNLSDQKCIPCQGGIPPLDETEVQSFLLQLNNHWEINARGHLFRKFIFPDFKTALDFTNKIAEIAERENHHPDIYLAWGKCEIEIWTHKIQGLTESDFYLAAKIDKLNIELV